MGFENLYEKKKFILDNIKNLQSDDLKDLLLEFYEEGLQVKTELNYVLKEDLPNDLDGLGCSQDVMTDLGEGYYDSKNEAWYIYKLENPIDKYDIKTWYKI